MFDLFNKIKTLAQEAPRVPNMGLDPVAAMEKIKPLFSALGKAQQKGKALISNTVVQVDNPIIKPTQKVKALTTNYDPLDVSQTREGGGGVGAAGIKVTPKMVAVSRKGPNSSEPILPYGTIIRRNGQDYLVADIKNKRYHTTHQIDFATPGQKGTIIPDLNGESEVEIVELGRGIQDAREKAKRF